MGWFREKIEPTEKKTSLLNKRNPFADFVTDEGKFITIKNGVNAIPVDPFENDEELGDEDGSARNRSDISE